jgi:hypothetical protein
MSGSTAFLEPDTAISPRRRWPPDMTISSIGFILFGGLLGCFAALQIGTQSRRQFLLAVQFLIAAFRRFTHALS